jgi:hypothetical protein
LVADKQAIKSHQLPEPGLPQRIVEKILNDGEGFNLNAQNRGLKMATKLENSLDEICF